MRTKPYCRTCEEDAEDCECDGSESAFIGGEPRVRDIVVDCQHCQGHGIRSVCDKCGEIVCDGMCDEVEF